MRKIQKIPSRVRRRGVLAFSVALSMLAWGTAIAPALPNPATPSVPALGETLLTFQTRQYAVRIFRQRGILRLNLYNRQTDRVEQRDRPMRQTVTDAGIIYTNLQGEMDYIITVAPDGSAYTLKIQQGDRLTYTEHVRREGQNQQGASPEALTQTNQPTANLNQPSRLNQRQSERQQASALQPVLDSETIARFQTPKYGVRIYSRDNEVRMNLYNRRTDKVELKAVPVKSTRSSSSITYSYPSGNFVYAATIMPIGGYRLMVTQSDRVIYNEQGY